MSVTGVMLAVKAAFSLIETAQDMADARASRFDFEYVFAPLPPENPLARAREYLTKAENWGDGQPHNQILEDFSDVILDRGAEGRIVDINGPLERQTALIDTLHRTFSDAQPNENLMQLQSAMVMRTWTDAGANRRDMAKLVFRFSGLALEFLGAYSHRLGLRNQAQLIVAAVSEGLASHIELHGNEMAETAFTDGASGRIADTLLTVSLGIAETRPDLFSEKESVQALVKAAVSPLRDLNTQNAGLQLNTTQRLLKIRETLQGPVALSVIQTFHAYRHDIFDDDYPDKESAAGIVTEALFEGVVGQVEEAQGLDGIFTPQFFSRVYPNVLSAVAASPEAFVRGTGQHVEYGRELLSGIAESLTSVKDNPRLAQSILEMGVNLTRRHARMFLVNEARDALNEELADRLAQADKPWAVLQIRVLSQIANEMISQFEANGLSKSVFESPFEQTFLLELVGLVADQVAQTPGLILGENARPEYLNIARGVAAFVASDHATLVARSDWQRVSAHAIALAMENPATLFGIDTDKPENFLAVTLINQVLATAHTNLLDQADGGTSASRQPGRILFGRTLAEALMATLDIATSHARQLATESGQKALTDFIGELNTLASSESNNRTLSSRDWIYAFRWFLSDVISTGRFDISQDMILDVVSSIQKGQALTGKPEPSVLEPDGTDPTAPTTPSSADPGAGAEVYYQPIPPQGANG